MSTPARSFILDSAPQSLFNSPAVPQGKRLRVVVNGGPATFTFASATSIRLDRAARARSIVDMFLDDIDSSLASRAGSWVNTALNAGTLPAGATFSATATIPGASPGDHVLVSLPANTPDGITADGIVTAIDTVKVRVFNCSTASITVPVGSVRVSVLKA